MWRAAGWPQWKSAHSFVRWTRSHVSCGRSRSGDDRVDAGVRDEDVEPAMALDRVGDERAAGIGVADVREGDLGASAGRLDLIDRLARPLLGSRR